VSAAGTSFGAILYGPYCTISIKRSVAFADRCADELKDELNSSLRHATPGSVNTSRNNSQNDNLETVKYEGHANQHAQDST
jgi:hypothetical protein